MIKGKVLLGLLAGFSVGTILGSLFASGKKSKNDKKDKAKEKESDDDDEFVVKY